MSNKYPNGMYKTTSKKQDKISQNIFKNFSIPVTMSTNFNQLTGNVIYSYCNRYTNELISIVQIDHKGNIL